MANIKKFNFEYVVLRGHNFFELARQETPEKQSCAARAASP
jgi:hypothetical protein